MESEAKERGEKFYSEHQRADVETLIANNPFLSEDAKQWFDGALDAAHKKQFWKNYSELTS